MNTKLESLLQAYSDSPTLRTQQAIEDFYVVSYQDRSEIQKRLIDFVKNNNVQGAGIEWSNFFTFDKEFCKEIILAMEENNAKQQLQICLDNKNKVFKESNRFNNELKRISILISKNEDVIFSEQDDITALYTFYLENRDMY